MLPTDVMTYIYFFLFIVCDQNEEQELVEKSKRIKCVKEKKK